MTESMYYIWYQYTLISCQTYRKPSKRNSTMCNHSNFYFVQVRPANNKYRLSYTWILNGHSINDSKSTSTAESSCKRIGTGEPKVGAMIPALSRVLWSKTSNLNNKVSNLDWLTYVNNYSIKKMGVCNVKWTHEIFHLFLNKQSLAYCEANIDFAFNFWEPTQFWKQAARLLLRQ